MWTTVAQRRVYGGLGSSSISIRQSGDNITDCLLAVPGWEEVSVRVPCAVSATTTVFGCKVKRVTWSDRVYATTDSAIYELVDGKWVRGLSVNLSMTTTNNKTPIHTYTRRHYKDKYTV